jgi:lipid-binding SYLF domain-containing protein
MQQISNRRRIWGSPGVLCGWALCLALDAGTAAAGSLDEAARDGMKRFHKGASAVGRGAASAVGTVVRTVDQNIEGTVDLFRNEATIEATRAELDTMAVTTLGRLLNEQPAARELYAMSAGYAVFDTRRLVVLGLAAGAGRGVAVSKASGPPVYMNMGTAGVGFSFGVGGFETQLVMFFENEWDLLEFARNGYDATAQAGAMFDQDKAEAFVAGFTNGRAIFYLTKRGWKVSATAAGTKYWRDADLN